MTGFNLACFTINIYGPELEPAEQTSAYRFSESDKRLLANLPAYVETWQEDMSDLLPEGYTAVIKEWSALDELTRLGEEYEGGYR